MGAGAVGNRAVGGTARPGIEAVAALVTVDRPAWGGTTMELAAALQADMKPNALAMRLNVRPEIGGRVPYPL